MLAVLSMATAVAPPTCTVAWLPAIAAGMTSARRVRTRSSVRVSCGPVAGVTIMIAVSAAGFSWAGLTAATPGVDAKEKATRSARAAAPVGDSTESSGVLTMISSGPLTPGPNPSASRS
jgi:hypothetical protein